ncbi:DNA-directed RNA polymerase, mitochondrial [Cephus cinctus]|uniref:DNA-directed RNA polymerase n=1 Tax=Cephus cinctus TaxID=211228 RepID=A0AAJ7FR33_CEPCN|nr:DNA-directed RNA polymerase, mitochondrial [Cephus cinctus]
MYRLLKLRGASFHYSYTTSVHANVQQSSHVCSFCKFTHRKTPTPVSFVSTRQRSTTINMAIHNNPVKKKVKKRMKKYAELLEITESTTSNRKAAIQTFNASQMSMLVDRPEIDLDELHKIKNSKRNSSFNASSNSYFMDKHKVSQVPEVLTDEHKKEEEDDCVLEDLEASGISDQGQVIKNVALMESLEVNSCVDHTTTEEAASDVNSCTSKQRSRLKKEQNELLIKEKISEINLKMKEEALRRNLCAFINVCINSEMLSRAFGTLMRYRKQGLNVSNIPLVSQVSLYEELMNNFARTTNTDRIVDMLNAIEQDNLPVNEQILAAVLECIARKKHSILDKELLEVVKRHMQKSNITYDAIMNEVKFLKDQQDYVIKAIRFINPNYVPTYHPPDTNYESSLLNNISEQPEVKCSPAAGLFTKENLLNRLQAQVKAEVIGHVEIISVEKQSAITEETTKARRQIQILESMWHAATKEAFLREFNSLKKREIQQSNLIMLHPYLQVLNSDEYVNAIIRAGKQLAQGSETFSPSLSVLYRELGQRIFMKYEIMIKNRNGVMDKTLSLYSQYCDWYLTGKDYPNSRTAWQNLEHKNRTSGVNPNIATVQWPVNILSEVGKFLYSIILKDLKFNVKGLKANEKSRHFLPAFYTLFRIQGRLVKHEIKPHPLLAKLYRDSRPETLTFNTDLIPSQCPPRPWISTQSSGYILSKTTLIRLPHSAIQQRARIESIPPKQIYPALDSLNQLGSIPWTVNNSVLDIAIEVFQNGGSEELNIARPPSVLTPPPMLSSDADKAERKRVQNLRLLYKRQKNEMYSLWCDTLYRLSLANHFRGDIFWLPHNMDFRGRVYPMPPHLNHLGSDLARSLLVFAKGKPLGPNGLDWLKIHTINLTGFKKRSPIEERLRYANEILDDILDSANKPLTGKKWWTTSDEPWQTLAACKEIAQALKSEDPAQYLSRFPIHQDGSCNGLQHYAALGRDQIGAASVNLYPADTPQDVYSTVAAMIDDIRRKEASQGLEIAQVLEGFIRRKVVKQTVMTTVYGVTRFGARLQIARQLKDIEDFPQEHVWDASLYLVNKTFDSLRTMFKSAREIQDWLTECARLVSQVTGQYVEWITPLGLPVLQHYSKTHNRLASIKIHQLLSMESNERPNTLKQKNAFPPNFIHSLDSTHMMLTSLYCERAEITFVSVHDCFWTHACDVEIMNRICREQFVALHSQPILQNLSEFMLQKYAYRPEQMDKTSSLLNKSKMRLNFTLGDVPTTGDFDLNSVLKSVYFFS